MYWNEYYEMLEADSSIDVVHDVIELVKHDRGLIKSLVPDYTYSTDKDFIRLMYLLKELTGLEDY